jgi:hypothetical protein
MPIYASRVKHAGHAAEESPEMMQSQVIFSILSSNASKLEARRAEEEGLMNHQRWTVAYAVMLT